MTDENKTNQNIDNTYPVVLEPPSRLGVLLILLLIASVVIFLIWGIWEASHPPKPPIQGQMDARTVSVSSKVPGRIYKVLVKEGDSVREGQPVAELLLPELEAKLGQVKAQEAAARAKQDLVDEGARPQEIEAAHAQWQRAEAASALAEKTYHRIHTLYQDGLVSAQRYDEVKAQSIAAKELAVATKKQYEIAQIGARQQEKKAIADLTLQASEGVKEVEALAKDKLLVSPLSAEVDHVLLVEGELAPSGFPIVTLVDLKDQWASFNFREEDMPKIAIGNTLKGQVPALGKNKVVEFQIYYISPRANYATWRSTRQDSGYDMRTFEVRARPVGKVEGLRPGMSVLVENHR